ncbi:NAD(P)-dependent oxidoreductase [Arthrobacter castelli]|uniref:NAD(P)-dependent oxidoreductase n=1 Tax=Arthrobacter castelli TaxID=271431 RepID=UPI000405466B|nr:NAD(P)-dependent oxidoreductase [Arthrobacter castelli]
MQITILGLGEAGSLYAEGLAQRGGEVTGFDPYVSPELPDVRLASSLPAAVSGADVVISLAGAAAAKDVTAEAAAAMAPSAVFADFNTGGPDLKRELARIVAGCGILFADVAVMAPVPRNGSLTPLLASGDGADLLAERIAPLGVPIDVVPGEAGEAAGRKLLRSVFMKGLAGLVYESVTAAEKSDAGSWMRDQIAAELGPDGAQLVERLITGTRLHAGRRMHEMEGAIEHLHTLDSPTWITEGTLSWLRSLADGPPEATADRSEGH